MAQIYFHTAVLQDEFTETRRWNLSPGSGKFMLSEKKNNI